ncbi:MAG: hypothetical protein CR991_11645 [Proteobacteria bacterium]|nr:MAG: hypothetical protein CR991_11645 [Pseudomonadota bacterium]
MYAADSNGNLLRGSTLSVVDGSSQDSKLGSGDRLVVKNADGETIVDKALTKSDIYDLKFRENMRQNITSLNGGGWGFTSELVSMPYNTLAHPEIRTYMTPQGWPETETITARNNYWEVIDRANGKHLVMRTTDNNGNPIKPSDAINDVFNNRSAYRFDCATPMPLLNMKSTLDTIGADDFNRNAGRMDFSSWYDRYDSTTSDGGFSTTVRLASAGEVSVNGVRNLNGETALFDPNRGDKLEIGSSYYFDKPGDNTTANQGWNAIYLGQRENGSHDFWAISRGNVNVRFEQNSWIPSTGFNGYYLGAAIGDPNVNRLEAWDNNPSVV